MPISSLLNDVRQNLQFGERDAEGFVYLGEIETSSPSEVNQILNNTTSPTRAIVPQPNILDQFASYTYSLSWYMLTPDQFKLLVNQNGKLNTNLWSLLVQSGGASAQSTSTNTTATPVPAFNGGLTTAQAAGKVSSTSSTTGRNKYFGLDYYLDDLEIESNISGHGMVSITSVKFKVVEPNGITLLANLNNAARDLIGQVGGSWQNVQFVMVIRFYGYDAQGNLVNNNGLSDLSTNPNYTNSIAVKYIPFTISEINFSMANKAVEYHIVALTPQSIIPVGSGLGSIPFDLELSGETVNDVLTGKVVRPNATATDGRTNTASPSTTSAPLNPTVSTPAVSPYALEVSTLDTLGYTLNNLTR